MRKQTLGIYLKSHFIVLKGEVFDDSKYEVDRDRFQISKYFITRSELRRQHRRWSNCFYLCFNFGVTQGKFDFLFTAYNSPMETLKMFLRMDGWVRYHRVMTP